MRWRRSGSLTKVEATRSASISGSPSCARCRSIFGGNWRSALRDAGIDGEFYACRERPFEERLPWEHIFLGVKKEYLWREWQRALDLDRTLDAPDTIGTSGYPREAEGGAAEEESELVRAGSVEALRWG